VITAGSGNGNKAYGKSLVAVVTMLAVLDLMPTEDVLPWRIFAADALVVGVAALFGFWVSRRLASRVKGVTGQWFLRHAWVGLAAIMLCLRGFYGPPIRLLLTATYDRCGQRLADRLARSPEARAWTALHTIEWLVMGVPESQIPRFLYRDLLRIAEAGIPRLDDKHLLSRMEAIAQGYANSEKNGCGTQGWNFLDVLWRINPQARNLWFNMIFDGIVAEVVESPPVREVGEEARAEILAMLAPARLLPILVGQNESLRQRRCREIENLYSMASALKGAPRVLAARLLAVEPIGEIGDR
jgi:hypothetical protein